MRTTVLTAYQKHVKTFAKTYKGKNLMKAAARAWNKKTGSTKKKTRKSSPKKKGGKKTVAKKTRKKSSGFRLPGGIGPKAVLTGVLGLAVVPRFLPVQSPGAKMLGTGLALRALKLGGGGALSAAGIIMLAGEFLTPYIGGFIGGAGTTGGNSGGYDF